MEREIFDQVVQQALDSLPPEFQNVLKNIAILVEDEPSESDYRAANIHSYVNLFGLYQGVPLTKRGGAMLTMPDRITIFRGPICRARSTPESIQEQVRSTVLHEIGHYFGMTEEQIRKIEKKRNQ